VITAANEVVEKLTYLLLT